LAYAARDVTSQKRAEAVLEQARDELEAMVQQRTAELLAANRELKDEILMRKRVEESLKTLSDQIHGQARMLDQILSSSPDHFFLLDGKGKFICANSTAAGVLGLDHAEMEGKYWWDLGLPEEPMKALDVQREAVLTSGEQRAGRMVLPTPGGERDFEYILSPIIGLDNEAHTVVATLRDITSEDRMREELERRIAFLEESALLIDLMPFAVIVRDMNDEIVSWNAGAEKLYGWSSDEVVGKTSHELFKTEFPTSIGEIDFELLEKGSWEGMLRKTARDGNRVDVRTRWVLRQQPQGQPAAVIEIDDSTGVQPPLK
jgi:PAS domain S-box-containing protein